MALLLVVALADVAGHQADGGEEHCGIIGEAEAGDEVGHQVARHHEIGERGKQHRLHAARRLRVEGGVVGADRVLEERHPPNAAFQLGPEAALYPGPIARSDEHTSELTSLMRSSYAVLR